MTHWHGVPFFAPICVYVTLMSLSLSFPVSLSVWFRLSISDWGEHKSKESTYFLTHLVGKKKMEFGYFDKSVGEHFKNFLVRLYVRTTERSFYFIERTGPAHSWTGKLFPNTTRYFPTYGFAPNAINSVLLDISFLCQLIKAERRPEVNVILKNKLDVPCSKLKPHAIITLNYRCEIALLSGSRSRETNVMQIV